MVQRDKGLIYSANTGGKDVFVHILAVERAGLSSLNEGAKVSYEVVATRARRRCHRTSRRSWPACRNPKERSSVPVDDLLEGRSGSAGADQTGSAPAAADGAPVTIALLAKRAAECRRPKSWEERRGAKSAPAHPQHDGQVFPAVFVQLGKWLRDRFFGTLAVKSVHGIERHSNNWRASRGIPGVG